MGFQTMDQLSIEKSLSLAYLICTIMGGIASITVGIIWNHWYQTLDQCVGYYNNCSCILYAQDTPSTFLGGRQSPCIWVTFGPLVYIFFAVCMICFHGYRVLFTTKSPRMRTTRNVVARMEPGEAVQIHTIAQEDISSLPQTYWITVSVLSVIFLVYSIVHFAIFTDGYYQTCNQYRRVLVKALQLHGTVLPVIHNRLYCQSIFDFMDYMHMDTANAYRSGYYNTGLALILGLLGSGIAWVSFLYASILNIAMARRRA